MHKTIAFCHDKNSDMLKLGCTLPILANIWRHKSTHAKFYPLTEGDKDLLEKFQEDVAGGSSIVFTHKAVVDENFNGKSTKKRKSIVGIDASQLQPYSMCQPMPSFYTVGMSIQKPVRSHLDNTKPVALKIWSCVTFNVQDLIVKLRASTLQADRTKLTTSVLMDFVLTAILFLKQWVAFTTFIAVKSSAHLSMKKIPNVAGWKELDEVRRGYIREKCFTVIEM